MKDSAKYIKVVAWSDEDKCFVGNAPGLLMGGCHGNDEKAVFEELCTVVEESVALYHTEGKELPPPSCGSTANGIGNRHPQ